MLPHFREIIGKGHASKRIYPNTLHIDRKSETATRHNYMYLKSPKGSKRISSSLMRDMVIAFRMTAKLFSFREEIPNRWIITRNGTTKLSLFPDLSYTYRFITWSQRLLIHL